MGTVTDTREHLKIIEVVSDFGGRYRIGPLSETDAHAELDAIAARGEQLSDYDCSIKCWCV